MLLHTFPKFLDNDFFIKNKITILSLLHNICTSVPCPQCSKHATTNLKKYNYFHKSINNSVTQLENNIHKFHNQVNKMLNKDLYKESILEEYENVNFLEIYKSWSELYVLKGMNMKLMSHKNIVNKARNDFISFINHNLKYFIRKVNEKKGIQLTNIANNIEHVDEINNNSKNRINKNTQHINMLNRSKLSRSRNNNTMNGFFT
jgi:hypothetical protein